MFSRAMNMLSIVSGILVLLVLLLWMRSLGWRDAHHFKWHGRRWEVVTEHGKITLDDIPQHAYEYWEVEHKADALQAEAAAESKELLRNQDFVSDKWDFISVREQNARDMRLPDPFNMAKGFMETEQYASHSVSFMILLAIAGIVPELQFLTLIAAALVSPMRKKRQRKMVASGRCISCGYDLRGSTHCCPECGTPILVRSATGVR